ncbi:MULTISPECIES: NUDIX hydrolase [Natrialbaceae]|uniref:NUDIX hydrolase n=1 Tax=Natrialbaceae TaxID=1644061 RepID=UPI00207D3F79|nr:NUDIX domain-containing protein [Natronococcus sp. CG52]
MTEFGATYVPKVCAYITRNERELLVFEGPEHDGLQIPKGTIEAGESRLEALRREVREESGLKTLRAVRHVASDSWMRQKSPPRFYRRHFFHASVDGAPDEWTHAVTGEGAERGFEFEFSWQELPPNREFAMALDDYVHLVERSLSRTDR